MLTKVRSSLRSTASTRALASLISTVSVEIATRRDTSDSVESKATLDVLLTIHSALIYSWTRMNPYCSPEVYSFSWDSHFSDVSKLGRILLLSRVTRLRSVILSDLDSILLVAAAANQVKVAATEKVLVTLAN